MNYASLKSPTGKFVGVDQINGALSARFDFPSIEDLFSIIPLPDGKAAILHTTTGKYVSAGGGSNTPVVAGSPSINHAERFTITNLTDDCIRLQAASGQYLYVESDSGRVLLKDTAQGSAVEPFTVINQERLIEEFQSTTCCCGLTHNQTLPGDGGDLTWNDETHKHLLKKAVELLDQVDSQLDSQHRLKSPLSNLLSLWPLIEEYVYDGLRKADYESEYTGYFVLRIPDEFGGTTERKILSYYKHFYDPTTRKNYLGSQKDTAMTEGLRYYYRSADDAELQKQNHYKIGFNLGLSLHYLTDLTQPMHAGNFTNVYGSHYPFVYFEWRHKQFEDDVEAIYQNYEFPKSQITVRDIDPATYNIRHPSQLFDTVARHSHDLFISKVQPLLKASLLNITPDEVAKIAGEAIPFAQKMVATYLLYWSQNTLHSFIHAMYVRVLDRHADPSGLETWGGWLKDGRTTREIIQQLGKSEEYRANFLRPRSKQLAARTCYHRFLGREPENQAVLDDWATWMHEAKWNDVVDFFTTCQEYNDRFGDYLIP